MEKSIQCAIGNATSFSLITHRGSEFLSTDNIIRLEAKSSYTKIYFTNRYPLVVAKVLKHFAPLLVPLGFVRTHRSHLINRDYILEVCRNGTIVMNDRSTAGISKRKRRYVFKVLGGLSDSHQNLL